MNELISVSNRPAETRFAWRPEFLELARHALLLLALLAAMYAPVWLADKTLIPFTGFEHNDWPKNATLPLTRTAIDTADTDYLVLPWDEYSLRCIRHGEWPWWNPYQGLGHPHWENMVTNELSPAMWLEAALPASLKEFVWLGQLWLAGIFTMMLARVLGLSWAGAALAGTAAITAPHFGLYLTQRHMLGAAMWWPLALWGVECLRRSVTSEGAVHSPPLTFQTRLLGFCGTAVGTWGLTSGGNPSIALAGGLGLLLYALVRIPRHAGFRSMGVCAGWLTVAGVTGLLLAAPAWLNFFPWLAASYNRKIDPISLAAGHTGLIVFAPRHIGTLLLPYIYGPTMAHPYGSLPRWVWGYFGGWYPAVVVFLSLIATWRAWTQKHEAMLVLGFFSIGVLAHSYGAPGTGWMGQLPLWRDVIFPRYAAFIPAFGLALLAGYGLDAFCDGSVSACRKLTESTRTRVLIGGAWFAVMAFLLWMTSNNLPPASSLSQDAVTQWKHFAWLGLFWTVAPVFTLLWIVGSASRSEKSLRTAQFLWPTVFSLALTQVVFASWGYSPLTYSMLGLAGATLLLGITLCSLRVRSDWWLLRREAGARISRPRGIALAAALAGVAILPLSASTWAKYGLPPKFDPIPRDGLIESLSRLEGADYSRSWSLDGLPVPNQAMPLGIFSLNVIEGMITKEEAAYASAYIDPVCSPLWLAGNLSFSRKAEPSPLEEYLSNRPFYEFAAVRYVTSSTPLPGLRPLQQDDKGMFLFEDANALPRVRLVTPELAAMSPADAVGHGMENGLGSVKIESFRANEVTILATNTKPCVVVLADAPKAGWRAWLNGKAVEMFTAHGCFRAIGLPEAGSWKVVMRYRPPWWSTSWLLASVGLVCLALSCVWLARKQRA